MSTSSTLPACPTKSAGQDGTKQVGYWIELRDGGGWCGRSVQSGQAGKDRLEAFHHQCLHVGRDGRLQWCPAGEFGNPDIDDPADQGTQGLRQGRKWISLLKKHYRSGIFLPDGFENLEKLLFGNFLS